MKTPYDKSINETKKRFEAFLGSQPQSKSDRGRALWLSLSRQQRVTNISTFFQTLKEYPALVGVDGTVQLKPAYDNGVLSLIKKYPFLDSKDWGQRQNFLLFNNYGRLLFKKGVIERKTSSSIIIHPDVFTPEFQSVLEFWWDLKVRGYFRDYKDRAKKEEDRVIALNKDKRYGVNDGGTDGRRMFDGIMFEHDHKAKIIEADELIAYMVKCPAPYLCVSSEGVIGVLEENGRKSKQFVDACSHHGVYCLSIDVREHIYVYMGRVNGNESTNNNNKQGCD